MRDIAGFENLYAVTKDGKVWSYPKTRRNKNGMWLKPAIQYKPRIDGTFYSLASVGLHKNKKRKLVLVHRLVAKAYIPNPENKPQVNHKDGNSLHNWKDNLEWVTGSENMQHAQDNGLLVQTTKKQMATRSKYGKLNWEVGVRAHLKFTMEEAEQIRKIYGAMKTSFAAIARAYNVSAKTIENVVKNKTYQYEI